MDFPSKSKKSLPPNSAMLTSRHAMRCPASSTPSTPTTANTNNITMAKFASPSFTILSAVPTKYGCKNSPLSSPYEKERMRKSQSSIEMEWSTVNSPASKKPSEFTIPSASSREDTFIEEFHDSGGEEADEEEISLDKSCDDTTSLKSWLESGWQSLSNASAVAYRFSTSFPPPTAMIMPYCTIPTKQQSANLQAMDKNLEPMYDVFLGGSCGNTVWRRELVIPYLKKRAITYYDPQRPVWAENMIYEESIAKERSQLFLFVLDPGTINATSFLEIAFYAARKAPKLVVVFLGRNEWSDKAHPMDLPDRLRTCNLLDAILKRHSVPMLSSITEALNYVDEMIIGAKGWRKALVKSQQRLPYLQLKTRHLVAGTSRMANNALTHIRNRIGRYSRRIALLLICQTMVILGLHFLLFHSLPIWLLLIPFLAIDYLAILLTVVWCKFKSRRKKKLLQVRQVVLPNAPIPRMGSTAITGLPNSPSSLFITSTNNIQPSSLSGSKSACLLLNNAPSNPRIMKGGDLERNTQSGRGNKSKTEPSFYQSLNMVECELRRSSFNRHLSSCSQQYESLDAVGNVSDGQEPQISISPIPKRKMSMGERMRVNGCVTSPIGYDVFLSCSSSSELEWITQKAVPQLHKSGLTYTSALMCDKGMRIPLLHTASHILYYIPSYKTFLSGMIEIAYFIGHADWQVTVCVPREAECLVLLDQDTTRCDPETVRAVQRRNECYRMAYCYLKDMAQRRQCRVFTKVEEAIKHIADESRRSDDGNKKAGLRQIVEKQHLVKERTQANLLAHFKSCLEASSSVDSNS